MGGGVRQALGDRAGAVADFERVLELEPGHPQRLELRAELERLRAEPDALEVPR